MITARLDRVADEAALGGYQEVLAASLDADHESLPADPVADLLPVLAGKMHGELYEMWTMAGPDGRVVAAVSVRGSTYDNTDLATVAVHVHPDERRRGHGRAAAGLATARVRELGRPRVLCEIATHTLTASPAPGEALARSLGAQPLHVERRRRLDLATLPSTHLDGVVAEARAAADGYSTLCWRDRTPRELVDEMAQLQALMSTDAPQGDMELEPEKWDAARYLELEEKVIARCRRRISVAAVDDRSGHVVAFTDLAAPAVSNRIGYQWATLVRREHRGRRLGLLVKAVNLQQVPTELPDVRWVNTWNADANAHMIAINERLGYRVMEGWTEWGLTL